MNKIVFLIMIASSMLSCQCEKKEAVSESWIPNMEQINLLQMDKVLSDELENLDQVLLSIEKNNKEQASESLSATRKCLEQLKLYYLPVLEVYQLIYDANHLYYLKRYDEMINKLKRAKGMLLKIGEVHPVLERKVNPLLTELNKMIMDYEVTPQTIPEGLKFVCTELVLMINKGELVLTDVDFNESH